MKRLFFLALLAMGTAPSAATPETTAQPVEWPRMERSADDDAQACGRRGGRRGIFHRRGGHGGGCSTCG